MSEQGWDAEAVLRRKIHERYILFILVCLLIGVLTVKWSEVPKLPEYLSFALTLASLLLAVMAIGYAIYSNRGMETNLASLVSSITDVREIASSLSSSSTALSSDLRDLSERTGGMDKRIAEIAENTKAQDQKKQVPVEAILPAKLPSSEFDLNRIANSTSINGKYVLIALVIAFLNKKALNMMDLFKIAPVSFDYCHGFLVACSTFELFEGDASFTEVVVTSFPGADEAFLKKLVDAVVAQAKRSKIERMSSVVAKDLGAIRTYLEDHEFRLFGSLEGFARIEIVPTQVKALPATT